MGPDRAADAIRKALSMGADQAVHLSDEALAGSFAVQTAKALAKVIGTVGGVDLVLAGNEASDGRAAAVPAMVADVLDWPALTYAREITVDRSSVTVKRETNDGVTILTAELPAVISVGEKINEPQYPSFKGIRAAKKKPVAMLLIRDAGIGAAEVGLANALTSVTSARPSRPRAPARGSPTRATAGRRSPRTWCRRSSSDPRDKQRRENERWLRSWSSSTTSRGRSRRARTSC